eukprot:TRINITY_DN13553_c0_g1_i1.p1 TRINITY_DN13553_c0_g1~~TRINITY_DN13553_c0_g1_i1.p1  ORF type:complete len:405 (-),score=91.98 TRINITY_DN13553_c0_g1_i1:37-1251(-)
MRGACAILSVAAAAVSAAPDQLADLKAQNPHAYDIVKGLLAKRKMGVLDPRHPAAFAAPSQDEEEVTHHSARPVEETPGEGLLAKRKMGVASNAVASGAGAAYASKDWLHWKPSGDDDLDVENVLDSVEALTGKSTRLRSSEKDSSSTKAGFTEQGSDRTSGLASSLDWLQAPHLGGSPAPAPAPEKHSARASRAQGNAYLADLGLDAHQQHLASPVGTPASRREPIPEVPKEHASRAPRAKPSQEDDEQAMYEAALGLGRETDAEAVTVSEGKTSLDVGAKKDDRVRAASNPYLTALGTSPASPSHGADDDVASSANPYFTALGLTKTTKADETPSRGRRGFLESSSEDKENPYLEGLSLELRPRKAFDVSLDRSHKEESKASEATQSLPAPVKDKLTAWLDR